MRKFCGMFVDDIIDEGEDLIEAREKAAAPEMYRLLNEAHMAMAEAGIDEPLRLEIDECLCHISGDECPTDTEHAEDERMAEDKHMAKVRAAAPDMYALLQAIFGGPISWTEVIRYGKVAQNLLARIDGKEESSDDE